MVIWRRIKGKLQGEANKFCKSAFSSLQRKRLKNDDFSIICSNCIGGIIYNRLGKQFLSPTINLWFHQDEFIKFLLDMKGYLEEELVFVDSKYDYPVGQLRDIKIYFAHYKTEEDARNAWNRRKARINYDNLYVIMFDRDGVTQEDLLKLKLVPCKGRVVLSEHKRSYEDVDYLRTLKPNESVHGKQFVDMDALGIYTFEKQFDYVGWLNRVSE